MKRLCFQLRRISHGFLPVLVLSAALAFSPSAGAAEQHNPYRAAKVVGYSTHENLTGCYAPHRCHTACGRDLNDNAYTVAANPRHGLGCGARIQLCRRPGYRCVTALVADRTASVFDFELTIALSKATGGGRDWAGARTLYWRRVYK